MLHRQFERKKLFEQFKFNMNTTKYFNPNFLTQQ